MDELMEIFGEFKKNTTGKFIVNLPISSPQRFQLIMLLIFLLMQMTQVLKRQILNNKE